MKQNFDYDGEARERWGGTDAYREHQQKTSSYSKEKWADVNEGMMAIFAEFAQCKSIGKQADSDVAQALVSKLQAYITANYYTCTDGILAGLGKMYVADDRFKKNIDKSGEGTAEFVADAIASRTKKLDQLKELLDPQYTLVDFYTQVLEEIGALDFHYYDKMTTSPIDVTVELGRLPQADFSLCGTLLTMLLREDHFSEGSFDKRFRNGEVTPIVERMIKLLQQGEV